MIKVGRYKSPDEHPFFPDDLPEPMLPPLQYPKVSYMMFKDPSLYCVFRQRV